MFSPQDILLTDQVAIITGGGQGIGEGVALNLASFGADIVIADKNPETAERTAQRVRAMGRKAIGVACDIRKLDQVEAMTARAWDEFGRVDILVNNAGGVRRAPFMELKERGWQKHIELNLIGLFGPTEAAVARMIEGGRGGAVINVSSIEAFRAAPNRSVYGACKAAMINFTQSLALELAAQKIRVNAVTCETILTPGLSLVDEHGNGPPELVAALNRHIPMGHPGVPDDMGGACVFLASQLSRYITGTTTHVDGGTWAAGGWGQDEQGEWQTFEGFGAKYAAYTKSRS